MRAYYGSRISENMTETPEGFLICHHVPIARTGYYEYMPHELGMEGNEPIRVYRSEEEVFNDKAIASFEGKPVALGHPPEDITPNNATAYLCGHMQNVRRGKGEEADLLVADLFVTNEELIQKIKEGLREVSCGYECAYEDKGEGMQQFDIRGNHVAVVEYGRAGDRVAIRDSDTCKQQPVIGQTNKPDKGQKERNKPMSKFSVLGKFMRIVNHDADPETVDEVMEVLADSMEEKVVAEVEAPAEEKPVFDAEAAFAELKDAFAELKTKLDAMCAPKDACKDPMDELEAELREEETCDEDESITLEEETCDEEVVEEKVEACDSRNDLLRDAIKELKPILAMLPEAEKKKATDAAIKALRGNAPKKSVHAKIEEARSQKSADAAAEKDPADIGREIMKKHNPHYQNK